MLRAGRLALRGRGARKVGGRFDHHRLRERSMAFCPGDRPVGRLDGQWRRSRATQILSQHADVDAIQLGGTTRSSSVSVGSLAESSSATLTAVSCSSAWDGIDTESAWADDDQHARSLAERRDDQRRAESRGAGPTVEIRVPRVQ